MTVSDNGKALTKFCEGLRLTAYRDTGGVPTIGYGHTGPDVYLGLTITLEQAEEQLALTQGAIANTIVKNCKRTLLQQELDALADFAFNEGQHALLGSKLWTMVEDGNGQSDAIDQAFGHWVYSKVGGQFRAMPGLQKRRALEAKLYTTGSWQ